MNVKFKKIVAIAATLALVITGTVSSMVSPVALIGDMSDAYNGDNSISYASKGPIYNAEGFSTRLTVEERPASYHVLNESGAQYAPKNTNESLYSTVVFNESGEEIPEDTVALVYYIDLSNASIATSQQNAEWRHRVVLFDQDGKEKLVEANAENLHTMFYGKASYNTPVYVASTNNATEVQKITQYSPFGGYSVPGADTYTSNGLIRLRTGSSGYVVHKFTKEELENYKSLTLRQPGSYGGAMVNRLYCVRDVGVLTFDDTLTDDELAEVGEDTDALNALKFKKAVQKLEDAYRTSLNYVVTNPYVYEVTKTWVSSAYYNVTNARTGHMPLGTGQFNTTDFSSDPSAPEGESLKVVYYYDNTVNNQDVTIGNGARLSDNIDRNNSKAIYVNIQNQSTTTMVSFTNDGTIVQTAPINYPANSYGYVIIDLPEGKSPKDYTNMKIYSGVKASWDNPYYVGGFGYLVDSDAFVEKVTADFEKSRENIAAAKEAIDSIESSDDFLAAFNEAKAAMDLLDNNIEFTNVPATSVKTETNILNALSEGEVDYSTKFAEHETRAAAIATVQAKIDALDPAAVTPASQAEIDEVQTAINDFADSEYLVLTNLDAFIKAYNAFRPTVLEGDAIQTVYGSDGAEVGTRYVAKMGKVYEGEGFTLKYGAEVVNGVNAVERDYAATGCKENYFGVTVINNTGKEVVFNPYVVYNDGEKDYFFYASAE